MIKFFRHNNHGFSLIELSVVLTIVGILVAAAASAYAIWIKRQQFYTTEENLETVRDAVLDHLTETGYLPCPAPLGLPRSDARYAKSAVCDGTAQPDTFLLDGRDSLKVRVGAVPTRSLGITDSVGVDGWGHILVYAVSESLANTALPYQEENAAIFLKDEFGNDATDPAGTAPYIIVSTGADGHGAYTPAGVLVEACRDGQTVGAENCNYQSEGIAVFSVAEFAPLGITSSLHYDDLTEYRDQDDWLRRLLACQKKKKFYVPDDPEADVDGCVPKKFGAPEPLPVNLPSANPATNEVVLVSSGAAETDGLISGEISCGGGVGRIRTRSKVDGTVVAHATAQGVPAGDNPVPHEIDAAGFSMQVPEGGSWSVETTSLTMPGCRHMSLWWIPIK